MVGHDYETVEYYPAFFYQELEAADDDVFESITRKKMFPFQDGGGEELGIVVEGYFGHSFFDESKCKKPCINFEMAVDAGR